MWPTQLDHKLSNAVKILPNGLLLQIFIFFKSGLNKSTVLPCWYRYDSYQQVPGTGTGTDRTTYVIKNDRYRRYVLVFNIPYDSYYDRNKLVTYQQHAGMHTDIIFMINFVH